MGTLKVACAQLGPIDTNTYVLMDEEIKFGDDEAKENKKG